MNQPENSSLRFSLQSLLLVTVHASLFLAAVMWALRGPGEFSWLLEDLLNNLPNAAFYVIIPTFPLSVVALLCGMIGVSIAIVKVRHRSVAAYHFAAVGIAMVVFPFFSFNVASIDALFRFSLLITICTVVLIAEIYCRKLPRPSRILGGVCTALAANTWLVLLQLEVISSV